jgi:hypothetical protein
VLSQTRGTHALRGTVLKLPSTHFIPAHHTVSVSLDASELCVANYDPRKCHESY